MDITAEDLNRIQSKVSSRAIQLNRALKIPYLKVRNGLLIAVDAEGRENKIGKAAFGTRTVHQKRFKLNNEH